MSIQNGILAKDKSYIQYDISPLSCGFENAVAITKLTIINTKRKNFFLLSVVCFQFVKNVFEFNSICADILNRRGTYVARYQRKIFKTTPVSVHCILDKGMPLLSCSRTYIYVRIVLLHFLYAPNPNFQNQSVNLPRQ